jgi:hypothetical protein
MRQAFKYTNSISHNVMTANNKQLNLYFYIFFFFNFIINLNILQHRKNLVCLLISEF